MPFARFGSEIAVNTTSAKVQAISSVAALEGGGFVVIWVDNSQAVGGSGEIAFRAQIFTAAGDKSGGEFLVTPPGMNDSCVLTALPGGGFAAIWNGNGAEGDLEGYGVFGQVFDAAGSKLGGEFLVNTIETGNQFIRTPDATSPLAGGGFVVIWRDHNTLAGDGSSDVRGQVFDAAGGKVGGAFLVNTSTDGFQDDGQVTGLSDGRFVVTWTDDVRPLGNLTASAVRGQIFLADGQKSGAEFRIDNNLNDIQREAEVTSLSGGRFAVTWTDAFLDPDGPGGLQVNGRAILCQIFAADGTKSGGEFQVNTTETGIKYQSTLTELADGRLLVTWRSAAFEGQPATLRAQLLSETGARSGEEFVIQPPTAAIVISYTVAALDGGSFVVSWSESFPDPMGGIDPSEVRAQIFDPTHYDGTGGNDTVIGGNFADVILGNNGDDTLFGWAGDDMLSGGRGNDQMDGGGGSDTADYSGAGGPLYIDLRVTVQAATGGFVTDVITGFENILGGAFDDILTGNDLANDLQGNEGADQLYGLVGADTLRGGNGDDYVNAGDGNDTVFGGNGNDVISGGAGGTDTLNGEAGADFITGGGGVDIIDGGAGDDIWLGGDAGDDVITGGAGNDRIDGGAGNDNLTGGLGRDYLSGGLGADRFVFNVADFQAFIIDTVGDFHSVPGTDFDAIRLQGSAVDYSFSNVNGCARIEHIATLGVIYVYNFTVAQLEDQTEYFV